MGVRGNRRRTRTTALATAYALLVVVVAIVGFAFFAESVWMIRGIAAGAGFGAVATGLLVRHQLLIERAAFGTERVRISQDYSRLTNARVTENAEFLETVHRRLDEIEAEVATVVQAGDNYADDDAPTVIDLKLRATHAS